MSTAVICPEKRNVLGLGQSPEQPLEKRAKLDDPQPADTATEGAKSGEGSSTHRKVLSLTVRSVMSMLVTNTGIAQTNQREWEWVVVFIEHRCDEMVKHCVVCGNMGNYWADDCPYWTEEPPTNEYWSGGLAFVPF